MRGPVRIAPIASADVESVARFEGPVQFGEEEIRAELALPWSRVWVAHEDGHGVVAFAVFWHVVDEIHILNLTTRLDRRRNGIGRALMDAVVEYALEQRVRQVLLEVRRSNEAALELYAALGFRAVGTRVAYYQDGEDAIDMTLAFGAFGRPPP
jgi:ribosomal-protein-alanine N-acetyltransferase